MPSFSFKIRVLHGRNNLETDGFWMVLLPIFGEYHSQFTWISHFAPRYPLDLPGQPPTHSLRMDRDIPTTLEVLNPKKKGSSFCPWGVRVC